MIYFRRLNLGFKKNKTNIIQFYRKFQTQKQSIFCSSLYEKNSYLKASSGNKSVFYSEKLISPGLSTGQGSHIWDWIHIWAAGNWNKLKDRRGFRQCVKVGMLVQLYIIYTIQMYRNVGLHIFYMQNTHIDICSYRSFLVFHTSNFNNLG